MKKQNARGIISRRELLAGAGGIGVCSTASGQSEKPNLVFVFSDQQSYDMLGCYGNSQVITPHIDRLASRGVRFNHCISNAPVCSPYRGVLLSGQHPLWSGALCNDLQMVPGNGKYFGEVLRDNGYRMGYIGKWHLYGGNRERPIPAGPYRYGFDHTFLSNNTTLFFDKERAYYWDEAGRKQPYGDWEPYAQTRQALQFLDATKENEPFALFISWHPPHNWQGGETYPAPDELLRKYDLDKVKVRSNCENSLERRTAYRGHMALCTSLDNCMGWLMQKLDDKGRTRNTILVYTSDHGDLLMSHGLRRNKARAENESIHVPLIIAWPRRLGPRVSDLMVGTLDLMPTLLGLMGIEPPATCQGRGLARAIERGDDSSAQSIPLFMHFLDWRGIYTERHTYSFSLSSKNPSWWISGNIDPDSLNRMFDRRADPWELKNLYYDPSQRSLRQELHERTLEWMKQFDDSGLSYSDIISKVEVEEDLVFDRERQLQRGTGRLKGRPIDFL